MICVRTTVTRLQIFNAIYICALSEIIFYRILHLCAAIARILTTEQSTHVTWPY